MPSKTPGRMAEAVVDARLQSLLMGRNADPFEMLGPHITEAAEGRRWSVYAYRPYTVSAELRLKGNSEGIAMRKIHALGFYAGEIPGVSETPPAPSSYTIRFHA